MGYNPFISNPNPFASLGQDKSSLETFLSSLGLGQGSSYSGIPTTGALTKEAISFTPRPGIEMPQEEMPDYASILNGFKESGRGMAQQDAIKTFGAMLSNIATGSMDWRQIAEKVGMMPSAISGKIKQTLSEEEDKAKRNYLSQLELEDRFEGKQDKAYARNKERKADTEVDEGKNAIGRAAADIYNEMGSMYETVADKMDGSAKKLYEQQLITARKLIESGNGPQAFAAIEKAQGVLASYADTTKLDIFKKEAVMKHFGSALSPAEFERMKQEVGLGWKKGDADREALQEQLLRLNINNASADNARQSDSWTLYQQDKEPGESYEVWQSRKAAEGRYTAKTEGQDSINATVGVQNLNSVFEALDTLPTTGKDNNEVIIDATMINKLSEKRKEMLGGLTQMQSSGDDEIEELASQLNVALNSLIIGKKKSGLARVPKATISKYKALSNRATILWREHLKRLIKQQEALQENG